MMQYALKKTKPEKLFISYRKRLDGPHHQVLLWHIFGIACAGFKLGRVSITGDGDPHLHIICHRLFFKLSLRLKSQQSIMGYLVEASFNYIFRHY